jgi:hypothetical protein
MHIPIYTHAFLRTPSSTSLYPTYPPKERKRDKKGKRFKGLERSKMVE